MGTYFLPSPMYEIAIESYTEEDVEDLYEFLKTLSNSQICYQSSPINVTTLQTQYRLKTRELIMVTLYSRADMALFELQFGDLPHTVLSTQTYANQS